MEPLADQPAVAVGAWIGPRLGPFGGRVGSVVPQGFDAYARVLHPVEDGRGGRHRWADVAAVTGRTVHPLAQFWRVAGRRSVDDRESAPMRGAEPRLGSLAPDTLAVLLELLAPHSDGGAAAECVAALWEGRGGVAGAGARLELPERGYQLFGGPLSGVPTLGRVVSDVGFVEESPNLLWPRDRSWCVATEIDFDSTLVGGSAALIASVLADARLEAFAVGEGDSLQYDADTVN
jgi:hypothetical protein